MRKVLIAALALVFALAPLVSAAPATAFIDVPANDPAYADVQALVKAGLVTGIDGKFDGSRPVTRYEMASVVAKAIKNIDKANAKDRELIQKLAVEFEAQLEEMNVRVTAIEDKGKKALDWFSPTMPKWSGEFYVYYADGPKTYFSPDKNGAGTQMTNQTNSMELDLNFNGQFSTDYNINYHGGVAFKYNYSQQRNADGSLTSLLPTFDWNSDSNVYIDGDLPIINGLTQSVYGGATTFAVGRISLEPGADLATDTTINGARLNTSFGKLNVSAYAGMDADNLAYIGTFRTDSNVPGAPGRYDFLALVRPSSNQDLDGENIFTMYGETSLDGQKWTGYTGYSAMAAALDVSYPLGFWTLKGSWTSMMPTNMDGYTPYVGEIINGYDGTINSYGYGVVQSVAQISSFNALDTGIGYDDGYWHGQVGFAYSPTYDGYNTASFKNVSNSALIAINTALKAEIHAGVTDKMKPGTYDGYLLYSNAGPLAGYAVNVDSLGGAGGIAYKAGFKFVPMRGTLWENSIEYIESATSNSTDNWDVEKLAPISHSTVFATKFHLYF